MGLRALGLAAVAALALAASSPAPVDAAQVQEPLASGHWRGVGKPAGLSDLTISLHRASDGAYHGLAARGEEAWPVRNIAVVDGRLQLVVPALDATFAGRWDSSARTWRGTWTEDGRSSPLTLGKSSAPRFTSRGADPYARPQRLVVLPDGRWMNIYCQGQGSPTVILDSAIGGGMADWAKVHKSLASITRTCAYDRAGYGFSDPGPLPREASAAASDLAELLKGAGVKGPYVLVGHSAASLNMRLFANWRFDDVAAMVLLDPAGDFQQTRFDAAAPRMRDQRLEAGADPFGACLEVARQGLLEKSTDLYRACRENDPARLETPASETAALNGSSSAQNLVTQRKYDSLPLIVLTRDQVPRPGFSAAEADAHYAVWTQIHDEIAALSTRGVRRTVPGAGHYIQNDRSQAVVDAVNEAVWAARRKPRNGLRTALSLERRKDG